MDLNVMMREQATAGLRRELDDAVTNGDTEAARKVTEKLAALAVQSAPKAPPYSQDDIKTELEKTAWFGTDPKKSQRAIELGRHLDLKKFATAAAFTAALVKAVDDEFKPATPAVGDEGEGDEDEGEEDDNKDDAKPAPRQKKTDGPGEGDASQRGVTRRTSGPWTKLSDAPADIRAEVNRAADRFVPSTAPKEQRDKFIANALGSHYTAHQRKKGK